MIFRHPPGAGHLPRGKTCQSFPPGRLARWHAAGRTLSDRGEHLEDFYACLYYAALRPLEALKLRESDLHLPKKGGEGSTWPPPPPVRAPPGPTTHRPPGARPEAPHCPRDPHHSRPARTLPAAARPHQALRHYPGRSDLPDGQRRPPAGLRLQRGLDRGPRGALTPAQYRSPLGRRPYDLRHAAVSLWLNSGVPATEVARRAGHGVAVLLKIYAHGTCGQADAANQRITDASAPRRPSETPVTRATATASRRPEMAGQGREAGRGGRRNRSHRPRPWPVPPRPWPARPPEHGAHGRIADGGSPESHLEAHMCWSVGGGSGGASRL